MASRPAVLLMALLIGLAACQDDASPAPGAPADEGEFQGLSREEIEAQAEPMTLEEAERLGIVDTTIRIEPPIHPDSVVHLEEAQILPADTIPQQ